MVAFFILFDGEVTIGVNISGVDESSVMVEARRIREREENYPSSWGLQVFNSVQQAGGSKILIAVHS